VVKEKTFRHNTGKEILPVRVCSRRLLFACLSNSIPFYHEVFGGDYLSVLHSKTVLLVFYLLDSGMLASVFQLWVLQF
jgi:hypothetical protein